MAKNQNQPPDPVIASRGDAVLRASDGERLASRGSWLWDSAIAFATAGVEGSGAIVGGAALFIIIIIIIIIIFFFFLVRACVVIILTRKQLTRSLNADVDDCVSNIVRPAAVGDPSGPRDGRGDRAGMRRRDRRCRRARDQ
jgi:hypothetical protein